MNQHAQKRSGQSQNMVRVGHPIHSTILGCMVKYMYTHVIIILPIIITILNNAIIMTIASVITKVVVDIIESYYIP